MGQDFRSKSIYETRNLLQEIKQNKLMSREHKQKGLYNSKLY